MELNVNVNEKKNVHFFYENDIDKNDFFYVFIKNVKRKTWIDNPDKIGLHTFVFLIKVFLKFASLLLLFWIRRMGGGVQSHPSGNKPFPAQFENTLVCKPLLANSLSKNHTIGRSIFFIKNTMVGRPSLAIFIKNTPF